MKTQRRLLLAMQGLPSPVFVPGHGEMLFGPYRNARVLAKLYMRKSKRPYKPPRVYLEANPARGRRIAHEYDILPKFSNDRATKAAYDAFMTETLAQYAVIKKYARLTVDVIQVGQDDPYAASPRLAILDVTRANHLWLYPSMIGFGNENAQFDTDQNPLLQWTDEYIGEQRLCVNDVFRIVHDYFGHVKEGVGFRASGEENAWRNHAAMYSATALGALTTELRGQNCWANFGPDAEHNRNAPASKTKYAEQKTGLLPYWASKDGRLDPGQT